jgi:hypothetical protein
VLLVIVLVALNNLFAAVGRIAYTLQQTLFLSTGDCTPNALGNQHSARISLRKFTAAPSANLLAKYTGIIGLRK